MYAIEYSHKIIGFIIGLTMLFSSYSFSAETQKELPETIREHHKLGYVVVSPDCAFRRRRLRA